MGRPPCRRHMDQRRPPAHVRRPTLQFPGTQAVAMISLTSMFSSLCAVTPDYVEAIESSGNRAVSTYSMVEKLLLKTCPGRDA